MKYVILLFGFLFTHSIYAQEKVTIQLNWTHQFQFAGYYAAIEKGFYAEEGLEVELKELIPQQDYVQMVLNGESEYGISDASLVVSHLRNEPAVLVAQIFQYSPQVLIALKSSGIKTPYDLIGKRVMRHENSSTAQVAIEAMLKNSLNSAQYKYIPVQHSNNYLDLVYGKADAISGYITAQPFTFIEKEIPINIIDPRDFGVELYGDNLFTSKHELDQYPGRVAKMRRATLRGWEYALNHQQEIIEIILAKYNTQNLTKRHLAFEARKTQNLIQPNLIELGTVHLSRYKKVAEIYANEGLIEKAQISPDFIYGLSQNKSSKLSLEEKKWIKENPVIRSYIKNSPPFHFWENGPEGISVLILDRIAQKYGFEIEYVNNLNAGQAISHYKNKEKIDMFLLEQDKPEHYEYSCFSNDYLTEPIVIYAQKDNVDILKLDDLVGKKVAMPKGFALTAKLKKAYDDVEIIKYSSRLSCLEAVNEGKVDAYVGDLAIGRYLAKYNGLKNVKLAAPTNWDDNKYAFAIRNDYPVFVNILNKGLQEFSEEEIAAMYINYFVDDKNKTYYYRIIIIVMLVFFFVALAIAIWNKQLQRIVKKRTSQLHLAQNELKQKNQELENTVNERTETIRQNEQNFRNLFEQSADAVFIIDALTNNTINCNNATVQLFGLETKQEFINISPGEVSPELQYNGKPSLDEATVQIQKAFKEGKNNFEWLHKKKNGKEFDCVVSLGRVKYNGKTAIQAIVRDISKQKKQAAEIVQGEKDFKSIFESSSDGLFIVDAKTNCVLNCNPAAVNLLDAESVDFMVGKPAGWPSPEYQPNGQRSADFAKEKITEMHKHGTVMFEYTQYNIYNVPFICEVILQKSTYKNKDVFITSLRDISVRKQQQKKIYESEQRLASALKSSNTGLWDWNIHSDILYVNDIWKTMLGYEANNTRVAANFKALGMLVHPDDIENIRHAIAEHINGKNRHYKVEARMLCADNSYKWIRSSGNIVEWDDEGKPSRLIGTNVDISEQKAQQSELATYKKAIESTNEAVEIKHLNGKQSFVNDAFCRLFEATRNELWGRPIEEFYVDKKVATRIIADTTQGNSWSGEVEMLTLKKNIKYVYLRTDAIKNDNGDIIGIMGIHRDITKQKQQEQKIRESAQNLITAQSIANIGNINIDFKNQKTEWSEEIYKILGLNSDSVEPNYQNFIERVHPNDVLALTETVDASVKAGKEYHSDYRIIRPNGEVRYVYSVGSPQLNKKGLPDKSLITIQDITKRKLQEDELAKYKQAIESTNEAIGIASLDGKTNYINRAFTKMFAYQYEELLGINPATLYTNKELVKTILGKVKSGSGWKGEVEMLTRNGSPIQVYLRTNAITNDEGKTIGYIGIHSDITKQKQSEQKIIAAQETIQQILDTVPIGVAIINFKEQKVLMANDILLKSLQIDDTTNFKPPSVYADITQREEILNEFRQKKHIINRELKLVRHKSREEFWAYVSFLPFRYYNEDCILVTAYDADEKVEMQMQLSKAKEAAEAANIAKSAFLANMSHEIRTPMNSIIGFSEILSKRISDPVNKDFLDSIRIGGKNLLGLLNDILDFSKIEAGKFELNPTPINLPAVIRDVEHMFKTRAHDKGLVFNIKIAKDIPEFLVLDELKLKQVLINLVGNALKFTKEGSITVQVEHHAETILSSTLTFKIIDSGIGIPKNEHRKIFDAFKQQDQQDNRKFGGTGLGLSISSNLIKLMGSKIELESEKDRGSTFYFTIKGVPVSSANLAEQANSLDISAIQFEETSVLIVDDIENNRKVICGLLEGKGLNFMEADSGKSGIELAIKNNPDVILMDIRMPQMDGYQALAKIRQTKSLAKTVVVALTALINKSEISNIKASGFDDFISKPVDEAGLVKCLTKYIPFRTKHTYSASKKLQENILDKLTKDKQSLDKLKQNCSTSFNNYLQVQSMRKLEDLARAVIKSGQNSKNELIVQFGKDLRVAKESFNIEKVDEIIDVLSKILNMHNKE